MLVVPDAGEIPMLDAVTAALGLKLRLYKNNYTPSQSTVIGDFSGNEANFSGYAAATPAMGASSTISHKATSVDAATRTFTHNGGGTANTIYGYYVTDAGATIVYWAERLPAPVTMGSNGDTINVTLQLTLNSEN